jgi:hypothetical protein
MKNRIVFILALSPYFYCLPGQAVQFDYLSGYLWDVVGVDAAWNRARRHLLEAAWQLAPAWHRSSQVYGSQRMDKYTSMPASKREFDRHAWHYVGQAQWQNNGWKQRMVLAWTSAPKKMPWVIIPGH